MRCTNVCACVNISTPAPEDEHTTPVANSYGISVNAVALHTYVARPVTLFRGCGGRTHRIRSADDERRKSAVGLLRRTEADAQYGRRAVRRRLPAEAPKRESRGLSLGRWPPRVLCSWPPPLRRGTGSPPTAHEKHDRLRRLRYGVGYVRISITLWHTSVKRSSPLYLYAAAVQMARWRERRNRVCAPNGVALLPHVPFPR